MTFFKTAKLAALALSFITTFALGNVSFDQHAWAKASRLHAIERVKGMHERKHTRQIKAMIGVNPARTPWCGAAVGYAVRKTGGTPPAGHNRAIAWKRFGKPVSLKGAKKGDVIIFRNKRGHHVALYKGRAKNGRVIACGDNMSNSFKCSNYRPRSVVAVRR